MRPHLSFRTWVHLRPARSILPFAGAVLSVAKLALGQEAYYEQQVALGLDDYYAGRGESPGLWVGSGAEAIELVGAVEEGALSVLLSRRQPRRRRAPARAGEGAHDHRPHPRRGDRHLARRAKTLAPVAGYDLVFSCPKSVSLLHALTGDEGVRRVISDAHEASWQAALSYLEAEACVVRRGRGGAIREQGEGFVAAAFRHRTSRAQDPHLHTHVIVANLARSPDGVWRALDGEAILRTYRLAAGYLYEAHLRHELSGSLGVRWTEPVKGMAEIEGVPQEAIRAFSTRRQSLVEHMEAMGTSGFAASRVAALATRERKEAVDLPDLRDSWLARAAEMGLGAIELRGLLEREPPREPSCRRSPPTTSPPTDDHHHARAGPRRRRRGARRGERGGRPCRGAGARAPARAHPGRRRRDARAAGALHDAEPPRARARGAAGGARRPRRGRTARRRLEPGDGREPTPPSRSPTSSARSSRRRRSRPTGSSAWRAPPAPARRRRCASSATRSRAPSVPVLGAAPSGRAADELERATDIPAGPSTPCWPMRGARAAFRPAACS